jgi:hypothetical protein
MLLVAQHRFATQLDSQFFISIRYRDREETQIMMISFRGKKRDRKRLKEYNGKKMKEAKQTQRELAQLKESQENVKRAVADLKEKHYNEINVIELDRLVDIRKLEGVIDYRESELWKKKDLVEELKQELDDQDDELAKMEDALAAQRDRYERHSIYWSSALQAERSRIRPCIRR